MCNKRTKRTLTFLERYFLLRCYYLAVAKGVSTPHIESAAAKRIVEARKNIEIRCMTDLEQVIGASLTEE